MIFSNKSYVYIWDQSAITELLVNVWSFLYKLRFPGRWIHVDIRVINVEQVKADILVAHSSLLVLIVL